MAEAMLWLTTQLSWGKSKLASTPLHFQHFGEKKGLDKMLYFLSCSTVGRSSYISQKPFFFFF